MITALRVIRRMLLTAGVCLLAHAGFTYFYAKAYQIYLAFTFRPESPVISRAHAVPLTEGIPVAILEIPRLDLSVTVLEGVAGSTLDLGAGHIPETPFPGSEGNVGIAAHRDTFFRPLKDIRNGDLIRLRTPDGTFDYNVEWTRVVKPDAVEVLDPTREPSLTLVTCYPFYYVGSAPDRFIVRARQI